MTFHEPWIYNWSGSRSVVFVVGQNPGKSRDKKKRALVGNRTGDYMQTIVNELKFHDVYFTNACNHTQMTKKNCEAGIAKLAEDMLELKPVIIISMGKIAHEAVEKAMCIAAMSLFKMHYKVVHPSSFLRFNKKKEKEIFEMFFEYAREKQHELQPKGYFS